MYFHIGERQDILSYDLATSIRVHCDNYGFQRALLRFNWTVHQQMKVIMFCFLNSMSLKMLVLIFLLVRINIAMINAM